MSLFGRSFAQFDQFRFGERHPYGLGHVPRQIRMESKALLQSDGHVVLEAGSTLPLHLAREIDEPMATRVMQLVWSRLDETFHRSTLLRRWRPLRVVAMTQGSLEVNGSAGQVTDIRVPYFYIGLHAGLFIHTADRLLRILADPRSLPEFGDATRERIGNSEVLLAVKPGDPLRQRLAIDLTTLALLAVFAHEIAHIVRGHIWLLRSRFNVSRLFEASTGTGQLSSNVVYDRMRRAMELDADMFAGKVMGTLLFRNTPPAWCVSFGSDRRGLLRMLSLSITCAFRAFDDQSASTYYHTPFMRAQFLILAAKHISASEIPFELGDFRESAWLPEILKVLRKPSDRIEHEELSRDYEALQQTLASLRDLQNELDTAHAEMDAMF